MMCEFVSWIEAKRKVRTTGENKIYFLTSKQINSAKGKKLLASLPLEDFVGHGAIRLFYGLERDEGENRERMDFSNPDNFPSLIVRAVKNGGFQGLASPRGLLEQQAWAEYYKAKEQARAEFDKVREQALTEYYKVEQQAWAEYEKVGRQVFWDLFAIPENRVEAWR